MSTFQGLVQGGVSTRGGSTSIRNTASVSVLRATRVMVSSVTAMGEEKKIFFDANASLDFVLVVSQPVSQSVSRSVKVSHKNISSLIA